MVEHKKSTEILTMDSTVSTQSLITHLAPTIFAAWLKSFLL